jgi:hypothetical protein
LPFAATVPSSMPAGDETVLTGWVPVAKTLYLSRKIDPKRQRPA